MKYIFGSLRIYFYRYSLYFESGYRKVVQVRFLFGGTKMREDNGERSDFSAFLYFACNIIFRK